MIGTFILESMRTLQFHDLRLSDGLYVGDGGGKVRLRVCAQYGDDDGAHGGVSLLHDCDALVSHRLFFLLAFYLFI